MKSSAFLAAAIAAVAATPALAAAHPRFCKSSANGRYFRLVGDYVTVEQAGALGDGTNDQPAIQAAIDYAIATGIRKVRFTRRAYTLWTPVRTQVVYPARPTGHPILICDADDLELEGLAGGTRLTQKGYLGGDILTETQMNGSAIWRGSFIRVGGTNKLMNSLTLRNLIIDGTIPYDTATGNSLVDTSHKGLHCNNDDLANLYVYDCEMKRFRGEIFFLAGLKPDYCFVQNLKLSDSAQCLWNAGSLAKVVAVNLDCENAYQALEVISGKGHTYIGGRFALCPASSIMGNQSTLSNYPFWYPNRNPAIPPTWFTFIGTRFEYVNLLGINSWTRGNIVCVDTTIYVGGNCARDIDLDIEQWCDKVNFLDSLRVFGPPTLTEQIADAPAGTYYTPGQNIHIRLKVRRTAAAIAAGRKADGITLTGGLIDAFSCSFEVSGDVRVSWQLLNPVAGFKMPLISMGNIMSTSSPLGGQTAALTAGATTTVSVKAAGHVASASASGTAAVNIATTSSYMHRQRTVFFKWDNDLTEIIKFPAGGAGLGLSQDRYLYRYGDSIELEYCNVSNKWQEVCYQTSQQLVFNGSVTYDAPSIASGTQATTTVTVTGAALGDFVDSISLGADAAGMQLSGYVSAANTVTVVLKNDTGAAVNLASTTLSVEVRKKP